MSSEVTTPTDVTTDQTHAHLPGTETAGTGQVGPTGRPMPVFPDPAGRSTATARPASSPCATRRVASARPRRRSTSAPRWPRSVARSCSSTSTPRAPSRSGLGVDPHELDVTIYNLLVERGHDVRDVIQRPAPRTSTSSRPTSTCPRPRSSSSARWPARWSSPACCARCWTTTTSSSSTASPPSACSRSTPSPPRTACSSRWSASSSPCAVSPCWSRRSRRSATGSTRASSVDGILATMYDCRTLHSREVVARVVDHFGDQVFHTVISRTVKFPDATLAPSRSRPTPRRTPVRRPTGSSPVSSSPAVARPDAAMAEAGCGHAGPDDRVELRGGRRSPREG